MTMTPDTQCEPNLYETDIFLTYLQRLTPPRAESMSTKKRILIVEDEPEIANLIRMHMDRNGFAADMVHSGKAGIVEIEQNINEEDTMIDFITSHMRNPDRQSVKRET